MVDDLHSHFTGRYLPYGVWSERQLCGTHDGCTSTNRYSGYDLCAVVPSYFSFPVRNARKFLPLTPHLPFTSLPRQALLAQFFSRLQKLVAESRAGHCLGQRERAVHQGEQADCLFAAFASSINHLGE